MVNYLLILLKTMLRSWIGHQIQEHASIQHISMSIAKEEEDEHEIFHNA